MPQPTYSRPQFLVTRGTENGGERGAARADAVDAHGETEPRPAPPAGHERHADREGRAGAPSRNATTASDQNEFA